MTARRPYLALVAAALGLCAACSHTYPNKTHVIYPREGLTVQFKRYERVAERDFAHHWTRKAYRGFTQSDAELASPDQQTLLDQWGRPDYVRRDFRDFQDDLVTEWVYMDARRVCQFVKRGLVFEGELTDFEQLLIRRGYPDVMFVTLTESGISKQVFVYSSLFLPGRQESFDLANGWIVHLAEGN